MASRLATRCRAPKRQERSSREASESGPRGHGRRVGVREGFMSAEKVRASLWGGLVASGLAILVVLGSRDLVYFDAALVGYTFATLFAAFGIAYRYAMWLQRPPTALYWRRGWLLF